MSSVSVHTSAQGTTRAKYQPVIRKVVISIGDDVALHLDIDAGHALIDQLQDALRDAIVHQTGEEL